jgi:sec-independent protein translocase protein TatA
MADSPRLPPPGDRTALPLARVLDGFYRREAMPFEGAFSPVHWLIIAVVALLVLGPDRLPDAAHKIGRAWREFQSVRASFTDQLSQALDPDAPDAADGRPEFREGSPDAHDDHHESD